MRALQEHRRQLGRSPLEAVVQITGDGFRVKAGALQNTLESAPHLQLMLSRYAVVRGMQVAQTAACNRLHDIEQRLARWLLMTQDRVDSGALPITHDFLATMLGTDRSTVSLAAGVLQRKELIEYTRGAVKIVNRKKLGRLRLRVLRGYPTVRWRAWLEIKTPVKTRPVLIAGRARSRSYRVANR
jgi:hypothetical protein